MKMGLAFIIHLLKWEKLFIRNLWSCGCGYFKKEKKNRTFIIFIALSDRFESKQKNKI